jgi:hypothetical protein
VPPELIKPLHSSTTAAWSRTSSGRFENDQQHGEPIAATATGRKDLQRIKDLIHTKAALGIHPCIPLPEGADSTLSRELPA